MIIYLAQVNSDSTEGRGAMVTIGAFLSESNTRVAVRGKGVMGIGNGEVKPLQVFDGLDAWRSEQEEEIKSRALRKLTNEERRVLGL